MSHTRHTHEYLNTTLGKKIRIQRELVGLSQTDFGAHFGLNRIRIGQFEAGKRPVPASLLYQFATFFDVPLTHFFDLDETETPFGNSDLSREAWSLMRDFGAMHNPAVRKALADVVSRLAEIMDTPPEQAETHSTPKSE